MKKIFTLLLAVLMIASMSVTAFAAEGSVTVDEPNGADSRYSIDVTGTYVAGAEASAYISADITWGAMEFTYTAASDDIWDPTTHSYKEGSEAKWEANGNEINVSNHSNLDIIAVVTFTKSEDVTTNLSASVEFTGGMSNSEDANGYPFVVIEKPWEGSSYDDAPSATATITLEGELPSDWTTGDTIGTISLMIGHH